MIEKTTIVLFDEMGLGGFYMSSGGRWLGYSVDFDMDMAQLVWNGVPQTDNFSSCGSLVSKLMSFRGMVMVSLHSVMSRPVQVWANSSIWIILDIGVASETSATSKHRNKFPNT